MKITLGTMPLSTNKLYLGRKILTAAARLNKDALAWEAHAAYTGEIFEKPISVRVDFYYRDRRANDADNLKILFDAMKGIVWKDDRLIDEQHVYRHFGVAEPYVELTIKEL